MTRVGVIAVAALALLAGCSLPSDSGGAASTATLTPVPVSTDGGRAPAVTPTPDALVPGLTTSSVRDPFALAFVHRRALANRSFRRVTDERIVGVNGTLWREQTTTRAAAARDRFHYRKDAQSAPAYPVSALRPDLQIYYDGRRSLFRGTIDGEVTYAAVGGTASGVLDDVTEHDRLIVLYDTFRFRVRERPSGYQLVGTRPRDPSVVHTPPLVEDPRNTTLVVRLTADGRVAFYRLAFDGTFHDQRVRVIRTVAFRGVGETTVKRPQWYETAMNATKETHSP